MSGTKFIYPSEVFAAITEAKKRDPNDKFGDSAFRPGIGSIRTVKNNTRFMDWDILKKDPRTGKWDYVELNLKFSNLTVTANIYPPGHAKKKFEGARLQFTRKNTIYVRKIEVKGGKLVEVDEDYGKAKLAIYRAFSRIVTRLLKEKKVNNSKTSISSTIQTERIINETTQEKQKLAEGDEIIRVEIPFKKISEGNRSNISPTEMPNCEIYDITRPKKDHKKDELPFEQGTFLDEDEIPVAVTYGNIHKYITYGSSCSGIDCMNSVCFSNQGISLPSKVTLLAVKRSKGRRPEAASVFNISEFEDMSNATVIEEEIPVDGEKDDVNDLPSVDDDTEDILTNVKADDFEPDDSEEEDLDKDN
jgi:hypothetical protein